MQGSLVCDLYTFLLISLFLHFPSNILLDVTDASFLIKKRNILYHFNLYKTSNIWFFFSRARDCIKIFRNPEIKGSKTHSFKIKAKPVTVFEPTLKFWISKQIHTITPPPLSRPYPRSIKKYFSNYYFPNLPIGSN